MNRTEIVTDIMYNVKNKKYEFINYFSYENESKKDLVDVTIVMTTHDRKEQTLQTLYSFEKSSCVNRIKVIIVDDSKNGFLTKLELSEFHFDILHITIDSHKKKWINPCVNYNIGFLEVKTPKVIIQNAEVYHCEDIIEHVVGHLNDSNYLVFDVCAIPSFAENNKFYKSDRTPKNIFQNFKTNKYEWYQHKTNNRNFHFLTAITNENLIKLDGFDYDFSQGGCYDDDEFVFRIKNVLKLNIINSQLLGIHQYHTSGQISWDNTLIAINRALFNLKINEFEKNEAKVDKTDIIYNEELPIPCRKLTTIVTAYYSLNNIINSEEFLKLVVRTLKINQPMIIFCEESSVEFIKKYRSEENTKIHILPFKDLIMYKYKDIIISNREKFWPTRDQRNSVEVHLVQLSKPEFMLIAMNDSYFNTDYFMWMDFRLLTGRQNGSANYTDDKIYDKIDFICSNPRPRMTMNILNCWTNSELTDKQKFFFKYRYIVGGGFYTTDVKTGKFILNKVLEYSIAITMEGYGHGEEMMYAYVIKDYPDYFNFNVGDYQDMIHNYYTTTSNHNYVMWVLNLYKERNPEFIKRLNFSL